MLKIGYVARQLKPFQRKNLFLTVFSFPSFQAFARATEFMHSITIVSQVMINTIDIVFPFFRRYLKTSIIRSCSTAVMFRRL